MLASIVVAGAFGGWLFARKSARAVASAERLASETGSAGQNGELSGKMRLLDRRGFQRRWREVVVRRRADGSLWATLYRPRRAASFDLSGTRVTGRRDAQPLEKWWFAGPAVLIAAGDLGPVEFGFGTSAEADAAQSVLGTTPASDRDGRVAE